MKIYVASAFSKDNKGGNKAGVCLIGENLNETQKKKIASELGYAETAYISAPTVNGADFKLEYFTPAEEVPLCGHATIAAFKVMREFNILKKDSINIQTKSGILEINIKEDMIFMEQTQPQFFEKIESNVFTNCFDTPVTSKQLPIQIVSTGLRDIMLPVANLEVLSRMEPNFEEITRVSKEYDTVGIHSFVIEDTRIVCRNFAPLYDVPEESATGTSNCALACYLYHNDIIRKTHYIFEQGYSLNEQSEIIVNLEAHDNKIEKVIVGGKGYLVETKEIEV
jgi:PhzF family phenazine biosynthesis protein